MSRSISTSTLNLRFMQNAQQRKQLNQVEADRALVKDDGQWEVAQEVRDAWNLMSQPQSSQSVIHEESYLPFLFPLEQLDASSDALAMQPKGRRVFDKQGEEIAREPEPKITTANSEEALAPQEIMKQKHRGVHPNPISISATSGRTKLYFVEQPAIQKNSKTAKQAIYDNSGVGSDLRPVHAISRTSPLANGFLKPSGIDDPTDLKPKLEADPNIVHGARKKKVKRKHGSNDQPESEGGKHKKKKQTVD